MNKDRYRVVVNGHSAKKTFTKRGAVSWARFANDNGLPAHVERTDVCRTCDLHGCPGGQKCPDVGDTA